MRLLKMYSPGSYTHISMHSSMVKIRYRHSVVVLDPER
jgi:hypothetical protein